MAEPTQPSIARLRRFGVRPNRAWGQNFLIDSNILGVISRAAALGGGDVVLEIGGGLGVLSEHVAPLVSHLHVVEVDRALEAALEEAVEPFANVTLHWGDAMKVELAALSPPPSKVVANLPYGIAASVLLRTIEQLPSVALWVAMVQREVGERLAAQPGGREYGVSSVIAQLSCEVKVLRSIPRTVFHPVPNVDSVLVRLVRTGPAVSPALRALVRAAFAHRRKALARSVALSLAAGDQPALARAAGAPSRERVLDALRGALGLREDVRAERLSPAQFRELGQALGL